MTFSLYLQQLGFTILNSLPTCGLLYLTIRLAFAHAIAANEKRIQIEAAKAGWTGSAKRDAISAP